MTNSSANPTSKAAPQKYLFDAEFDYSETVMDIQSVTPRQLEQTKEETRQQAFDEGYAKGVADTNETIQRVASDQLFVITGKMEDMIAAEEAVIDAFQQEVAQLSEVIFSTLIPILADNGAVAEVTGLLQKARQNLPKNKSIVIEVHESLVSDIQQFMGDFSLEDATLSHTIQGGEGFSKTDCRISWEGAGLEFYRREVMAEIRAALLRIGGDALSLDASPSLSTEQPTESAQATESDESEQSDQQSQTE